jgi:hypothetical protein
MLDQKNQSLNADLLSGLLRFDHSTKVERRVKKFVLNGRIELTFHFTYVRDLILRPSVA